MNNANITGFMFSQLTLEQSVELLEQWVQDVESSPKCLSIDNPNAIEIARKDPEFAASFRNADMVTADGVGVVLASRILGAGIPERVCGPDLFQLLCTRLNEKETGTRMFFLGSTPDNLNALEKKFKADFPNLEIVGTYSPPYKPAFSEDDIDMMSAMVNESGADILWIGLGAPKQEKFAEACRDKVNVKIIAPVGAVFDFYTGNVKLPPKWVQEMGLIFFYRFFQQPKRLWRRNLRSFVFLWNVAKQRLGFKPQIGS